MGNHNMKAERSFTLALNEASDWTEEEVKNFRLGYIDLDEGEGKTLPDKEGRPDLLDHREAGLVTEVKNQGHCGSCWAFSATGGIEGVWAQKVGELLSVSEQQLVDCAHGSCSGGNMGNAWDTAKDGIMSEEDYPYEHKDGDCRYNSSQAVASVTGHESVAHNEHDLEKPSTRLATPSPLQSMQEVLSHTTRRESTTTPSALKENSTMPFCLLATTKLLLSPTGLSRTRGERTGVRTGTST